MFLQILVVLLYCLPASHGVIDKFIVILSPDPVFVNLPEICLLWPVI